MKKKIKKKMGVFKKCPNCKKSLKKVGLKFIEQGEMIYSVSKYRDKKYGDGLEYEQDEFQGDPDAFCCAECGIEICFTPDEALKILK